MGALIPAKRFTCPVIWRTVHAERWPDHDEQRTLGRMRRFLAVLVISGCTSTPDLPVAACYTNDFLTYKGKRVAGAYIASLKMVVLPFNPPCWLIEHEVAHARGGDEAAAKAAEQNCHPFGGDP